MLFLLGAVPLAALVNESGLGACDKQGSTGSGRSAPTCPHSLLWRGNVKLSSQRVSHMPTGRSGVSCLPGTGRLPKFNSLCSVPCEAL
uniref:Uncharacterized protein n=1 Tax=Callorhinchus milii TaxID=7868 RepID=A0A4W3HTT7_CALMI